MQGFCSNTNRFRNDGTTVVFSLHTSAPLSTFVLNREEPLCLAITEKGIPVRQNIHVMRINTQLMADALQHMC